MKDPQMKRLVKSQELRWLIGMAIASLFSLTYLFAPLYIFSAFFVTLFSYPSKTFSWIYVSPLILSILSKPIAAYDLVGMLTPMLDYFDYEEAFDLSNEEFRKLVFKDGKNFIFAVQPHGVISFTGMCSAVNAPPDLRIIPTAVASAVLKTPLIKNVMGIFGLIDASGKNFTNHIRKKGIKGCVCIYTGGIAELFKSCPTEERLYLKKRKGFIKIALREGVDVVPIYFFGNTSVLTIWKSGPLATLSRKLQVALTYFWGKFYLPIPRDEKLLYARGSPIGLPHILEPTEADVNKWHAKYCEKIEILFDKNKEKVPNYKNKKLIIE